MTRPIPSGAAPSIAFITGADAAMFGQLFLLLGSLRRNSPSISLRICDLGLSELQRDYLRRTRRLLERPAGRRLPRHAWYDKAALCAYTATLDVDFVVWLDADLIILNDIVPLVQDLCADMQAENQVVAAAGTTAFPFSALDWLDQAPGFKHAMTTLDLKSPYLNSGFIICRSREFLAKWMKYCEALPYELLFEQNAFNLAAYEQAKRIRTLDPWIWNLCGTAFRSVEVVPNGLDVTLIGQSGGVNILHATSTDRAKDLIRYDYHLQVNDTLFRPQFRIVRCFEALVKYQVSLVTEGVEAEAEALIASGLGSPGEPVLGTLNT